MKRFLSIVGNRPNLIKLDPDLEQNIIYTGQHWAKNMKEVFFEGLNIPVPDEDLEETELGAMIDKLIKVIPKYKPHFVIVYGDTRSTVAGAVAAHQLNIPVIHVEAGCRSGNDSQIEERNRKLVDNLSLIHLCPSFRALFNLQDEGIGDNAYNVGCSNFSSLLKTLPTERPMEEKYSVLTIHRAENTDDAQKVEDIFTGLMAYESKIVFPVHPRTKKLIKDKGLSPPPFVEMVDPLPYKEFIHLIANAEFVITDSGGVQAEAYFLRTACITLRKETEWRETVEESWNVMVGNDTDKLDCAIRNYKPRKDQHSSYAYGRGLAHKNIRAILKNL